MGRFHHEAKGAAIAVHGRLAIQRPGNAEIARGTALEIALHQTVVLAEPWLDSQRTQWCVVELLGLFKVVDFWHDVTVLEALTVSFVEKDHQFH